jgi:biotin carboxyl carrier protein
VASSTPVAPVASAPVTPAAAPVAVAASGSGETVEVPVPIMGESITTGTLVNWTVKVGDAVAIDQAVAIIETDKVSISFYVMLIQYNEICR